MIYADVKQKIADYLKFKYAVKDAKFDVLPTQSLKDGDFYTNVALRYAKQVGKNPVDFAKEVAGQLEKNLSTSSRQSDYRLGVKKPGFINFFLTDQFFKTQIDNIISNPKKFGSFNYRSNFDPIVLEYSSPNIAKPFGVGHLRPTFIGDSLVRLLRFNNAKVITDNHLGDWGTQYGKLAVAVEKWGDLDEIKKSDNPIKILVGLYVKFHDEADKDPNLADLGRDYFKKLEQNDPKVKELWKFCVSVSLSEFEKWYKKLGILPFDTMLGESFFEDKMPAVIKELKKKSIIKKDKGAWLVYFDETTGLPPLMIIKKDGTTLYATRDLAADKYRLEKYGVNTQIINEVGSEQSLYFNQLFETEKMLGWISDGQRIHIKHGLYRLKDGKMSTRKGKSILLSDLIKESETRVKALIKDSVDLNAEEKDDLVNDISTGALKWNDLKRESHKDIVFDWDEILNMQGNSGPYVQYTYARCSSVIRKFKKQGISNKQIQNSKFKIVSEDEREVLRVLARFPAEVERATKELSPHFIAHYLYSLCQTYNRFYAKHKIVGGKNGETRILITKSVLHVIENGLYLLGIKAPKKM